MPEGHWSKGPDTLYWNPGVLWFLPNHDVAYPFSPRILPIVAFCGPMIES